MERLIRSQYWTLAWVAAVCLGTMLLILPRFPDQSCSLPLWLIVLGGWLFAFIVSLIAQFASLRQSFSNLRIEPACFALALIFFTSAIAIVFSPAAQTSTNWAVSIGVGQLIVMSLGILVSIMIIERIHSHSQDEASSQALNLQRVTSTRIKHSDIPKTTRNKIGFFSKKPPQSTETPFASPPVNIIQEAVAMPDNIPSLEVTRPAEEAGLPQQTAADIEKADIARIDTKKPVRDNLPAEIRRLPSVTAGKSAGKVSDPNKRTNSTITKLQALSASGIGSVHHPATTPDAISPPNSNQTTEPGLRSVLDRLDTPNQEQSLDTQLPTGSMNLAPTIPPVPPPPTNETSVFRQPVDKEMDVLFAKIAPVEAQKEITSINTAPTTIPPITAPAGEAKLFQGKVDDQVEELFSEIAPAQAQRDVSNSAVSKINAAPTAAASPAGEAKLFQGKVDDQVEELFSEIAPAQAQRAVSDSAASAAPTAPPMAAASPSVVPISAPAAASTIPPVGEAKLFQGKVDDQIEELFSEIAPAQAQRDVSNSAANKIKPQNEAGFFNVSAPDAKPPSEQNADLAALAEQRAIAQELKDFGRLSVKGSASTQPSTPVGTMKTIGKLLIDSRDVDNIIKKAELGNITVNLPSARVISAVRGEGIQALLESIDNYQGIAGSMLVGEDGLVIASTYTTGGDRDSTGVLAHGMLGNSNLAMLRLDLGELEQMIMVSYITENTGSRQVTTILTDLDVGALAVFVDTQLVVALDQLLEQISTIARG